MSEELVELRQLKVSNGGEIEGLTNWKDQVNKELKEKNELITRLEKDRTKAND